MKPEARSRLVAALDRHAPVDAGCEPDLREAIGQLASRPGKLVRARLVLLAAEHHGLEPRAAEKLACAIEFFHTASLAFDDLPCMDDAAVRRGLPCVHRKFGEAAAILAALTLINRGYALAHAALARQPLRVRTTANECISRALGLDGLAGGQAWDLTFARTTRTARLASRIAHQKTSALFSLAIGLPAALARPSAAESRHLQALAVYWGQQFQIADDLSDVLATALDAGKTTGRDRALTRPNLALALGVPAARARLARLERQAERALDALCAGSGGRWDYLKSVPLALASATEAVAA